MTEKRHVTEYHIGSDPDAVSRVCAIGQAAEARLSRDRWKRRRWKRN